MNTPRSINGASDSVQNSVGGNGFFNSIKNIGHKTRIAVLLGAGTALAACGLDQAGTGDLFEQNDGGVESGTGGDAMGIDSGNFPDAPDAETDKDGGIDTGVDAISDTDAADDITDAAIDSFPDAETDAAADALDGDLDAGPCASALGGFTVTIKALAGNQYDWVLYDDLGVPVKDSLGGGVDEKADNVITGVKYDYVLVQQSKSSTSSSSLAEYAAENAVSLPAGCINETAKKAPLLTFTTMPSTDFKLMHDTCTGCTPISSSAAKPLFHYEYKAANPSYKSTLYHITFKKP